MIKINKKGQIGESIQDLVGLIIIALLLVIFFFVSNTVWGLSSQQTKNVSTQQYLHDQEHKALQAFMQKQVSIQEQEISMVELVKLSRIDSNYNSILDNEVKNAFDSLYVYNFNVLSSDNIANMKGSSFYIPSEEQTPIIVNLEIKGVK